MLLPIEPLLAVVFTLFVSPLLGVSLALFVLLPLSFLLALMPSSFLRLFSLPKPVILLPSFLSLFLTPPRVFSTLLPVFLWHLSLPDVVSIPALVIVLIFLPASLMLIALIVSGVLPTFS